MKHITISLFLKLFFIVNYSSLAFAQTQSLGSWNCLNVKYRVSEKLTLFSEAQLRSLKIYNNFHYHEVKAGLSYEAIKGLKLALCFGKYDTYKEGGDFLLPKNSDEKRLWQQAIIDQKIKKIKIEQRYRLELRFTTSGFKTRYRYRFGLAYEFGKVKNVYKPFTILINSELFFGGREPYFERNRSQMIINYNINKQTNLQIGYVHQFDYKINDETGTDFLLIGVFIDVSKTKNSGLNNVKEVRAD